MPLIANAYPLVLLELTHEAEFGDQCRSPLRQIPRDPAINATHMQLSII